MSELCRELEPIGAYSVGASHLLTDHENVTSVHCTSNSSPIMLGFSYPDQKNPLEALDDLHEGGVASYLLMWPSGLSREKVVELIQQVGENQVDTTYLGIKFPKSMSSEAKEAIIVSEAVDLTLVDDTNQADVRVSAYLDDVIIFGFNELSAESSNISLGWEANDDPKSGDSTFGFIAADNHDIRDLYILNLVERTITARHIGSVATALENLGAIFDKYSGMDPAELHQ